MACHAVFSAVHNAACVRNILDASRFSDLLLKLLKIFKFLNAVEDCAGTPFTADSLKRLVKVRDRGKLCCIVSCTDNLP